MILSRRDLLVTASAALALHSVAARAASASSISEQVKALFESLPGTHHAQVLGAVDGHDK